MKKRGFTLLEMLLVVAILSLLIAVGFSFISNSMKTSARERFKAKVDSDAADIINFMGGSLKRAWQTEIEVIGDDGKTVLLGSNFDSENFKGKGFRVHLPDITKSPVPFYERGKSDEENKSYALSFVFDEDSRSVKISKQIPDENTYTREVLKGFVKNFTVNTVTSEFVDIELKINYKGYNAVPSPFGYNSFNTFTLDYNVRNKQVKDKSDNEE